MTKLLSIFFVLLFSNISTAQSNDKISTIDFVQVVDGNKAEALFYYENNWKALRKMAAENDYIDSFQFLETEPTKDAPFHFILITTYSNPKQFEKRENNFATLIDRLGEIKLLNNKKPTEFRKILFGKENVNHLE